MPPGNRKTTHIFHQRIFGYILKPLCFSIIYSVVHPSKADVDEFLAFADKLVEAKGIWWNELRDTCQTGGARALGAPICLEGWSWRAEWPP